MPRVRLAGVLVSLAGGARELEVPGSTVGEVLESLASVSRALYERVVGPGGEPRGDIYIAVNDVDIRLLSGLSTRVEDKDTVLILAYLHPG
jgi:molybdopterin converting factor small subunit